MGAHPSTPIYGLPECTETAVFQNVITNGAPCESTRVRTSLTSADDFDGMEKEVVEAAQALCNTHPKVKAIVLECTNMPPFSRSVAGATGRKVFDILTLGKWLYSGAVATDWKEVQASVAS